MRSLWPLLFLLHPLSTVAEPTPVPQGTFPVTPLRTDIGPLLAESRPGTRPSLGSDSLAGTGAGGEGTNAVTDNPKQAPGSETPSPGTLDPIISTSSETPASESSSSGNPSTDSQNLTLEPETPTPLTPASPNSSPQTPARDPLAPNPPSAAISSTTSLATGPPSPESPESSSPASKTSTPGNSGPSNPTPQTPTSGNSTPKTPPPDNTAPQTPALATPASKTPAPQTPIAGTPVSQTPTPANSSSKTPSPGSSSPSAPPSGKPSFGTPSSSRANGSRPLSPAPPALDRPRPPNPPPLPRRGGSDRLKTIIVVERVEETGVTLVSRARSPGGGALILFLCGAGLLLGVFLLLYCLYRRAAHHQPFAHHRLHEDGYDEPVLHLDSPKDPYDLYFYAPDAWIPSHIATKQPPPQTPPLPSPVPPKLPPPTQGPPKNGKSGIHLEPLSAAALPNNFV